VTDTHPMSFLNLARQYQKAAGRLLASVEQEPKVNNQVPLSDPIYFLYFHTVELALKAFLRYHRQAIHKGAKGHDIVTLHSRCQALGLRLDDDPLGLQNVVNLLASGNGDHGFRYFTLKSCALPELPWARDVVNSLIQVVRERVDDNTPPGPAAAVKIQIILGKPREREGGPSPSGDLPGASPRAR
jgi:hypothetical protein